jgi:hypothetical protein
MPVLSETESRAVRDMVRWRRRAVQEIGFGMGASLRPK